MRYNQWVLLFCVALSGCATPPPPPVKPVQLPQDELAFAGRAGRYGASAAKLGVKAMTHDELKSCARTIMGVNEASGKLSVQSDILKSEKTKLAADQKQLEEDRLRVDKASSRQVNAFNARLTEIQEALRSFNRRVDIYNRAVGEANRLNNTFNLNCAERPYRVADLGILPEAERQAMESGAKPFDLPVY